MKNRPATLTIHVEGMTCASCEQRIQQKVGAIPGVSRVRASASLGEVTVDRDPFAAAAPAAPMSPAAFQESIHAAIRAAGYNVREEPKPAGVPPLARFLGLLAIVAAVYFILKFTVGFTFLPAVSQSMGYGLIFVVGLLTSLHCIAMCGGIVLSQSIRPQAGQRLVPGLLYNAGRVVSYTIIGGAVGALGSLFSLSTALQGLMPVLAGAFMLFLGVRMLGIWPWLSRLSVRLPGVGGRRMRSLAAGRGPFVVGFFNGLMPCGPLQTMQVYALGTGSFLAGALSMFLFSLGTVPLLLGFSAVSTFLSAKFNRRMVMASGVLVMALGLVMVSRGANLFGVALPSLSPRAAASAPAGAAGAIGARPAAGASLATLVGGFQEVRSTVEAATYHPITVKKGVPVRWTISVKASDLNGCNGTLTIPQYGIRKVLAPGDNLVEFTPAREGTITYTCWMGMITSTITVVSDLGASRAGDIAAAFDDGSTAAAAGSGAAAGTGTGGAAVGCCGTAPAGFAGGQIPTAAVGVAVLGAQGQSVTVTVDAAGYTPAVLVLQKGVKARIRFVARALSACNSQVDFPEYNGRLDLAAGQLETPSIDVTTDFTFQCGMGMLHGYVKVVNDLSRVDLGAVRQQVAAYTPATAAVSCCGR